MSEEKNIKNDLKKIRKEKGLSLLDVATKLKLTQDVINKLESSRFKELGAYTYVRGYINHYTDLLGVDSNKYLELVPRSEFDFQLVNTSSQQNKVVKFKSHSKNMASYVLGTFVVVAISISGWFLLKNYSSIFTKPMQTIEISKTNNLEILPKDKTLLIDSEDIESQESKNEAYHYSSLIPSNEQSQNHEEPLSKNDNELLIPNQSIIDDDEFANNEIIPKEIIKPSYDINVETTETSWLKIEEIDGIKLHNNLLQPGQINVKSEKPVHFRIGNAKSVKVIINGEIIDLSKYSRKNIVDFNWPQEG